MATLRYDLPAAEARSLQAHLNMRGYEARVPLLPGLMRRPAVTVLVDVGDGGEAQVDTLVRRLAPSARRRR